ncbi:putative LRR receptor-like serine/threonine-protein kinase [Hibiscus syriacus]|uniref:non-specific serine/threonine protein kinase n=1 Tax=Hibiscus syriacus TaxID=106335 RepID=A0A6A3C235_HIBSY|nr:putative LRR receptor-like serine/threonine-protein kinase [Hibiscus syriacus]
MLAMITNTKAGVVACQPRLGRWASDNAFTGKIPEFFGNLTKLTTLRFEGNSFKGPIPSSLANLTSLTSLRIGDIYNGSSSLDFVRNLKNLTDLDLSYSFLSGNLPSWVNSGLQLNLVANNFTLNSTSIRRLPGLECLQRSFPCFRNSLRYANFSIKCGGPALRSDGITFEADNSTLGPATFNVTSTRKWATSRLSPGSLRYYGIGLENGPYTVRLFFAETGFPERASESWRSLGRRVFDVYQVKFHLMKKNVLHLDWRTRFNICLSTARGLAYLHEESRPRIVHRDVKASNILLDEKFCPNISDFGLEKLYDDKKTHVTTRATGTIGYLAPEYAMRGHLPEKVDVFGFGVVILEIMSGRPNSYNTLENDRIYLLEWAWTLHENNQPLSLLDPTLAEFDENEALRMIGVALLCTQASPSMRPPMSRVVGMLAGDIEVSNVTTKPSYITDWNFQDITDTFMDEETRTSIPSDHSNSDVNSKNKTTSGEDNQPIPSPVNMTEFKESIGEGSPGVGSNSLEFRTLGSLPSCNRKMILNGKPPSCSKCLLVFLLFIIFFIGCSKYCNAQTPTTTTDPSEVRALNEIFKQWETQAPDGWNITGEPCSGVALSQSDSVFEDSANNPSIRCDCSFENATVCHITRLRVFSLEKRGRIPEQLLAFRYLNFFMIDQNFFTGPLPAFIGNLSKLQLLSVAHNSLSGPIPKEIGNLKKLYLLSLGVNNFSGAIPPELGNLVELQQLYINSCGLTGEFPSTFAKLWNLQIVGASDNAFTGKIPEFIGSNWTRLESLRLEGNSFEGPIPSNIGNLTSLTILRITGIWNGSSSLDFVTNLRKISDLVLRNVLLTGSIPSDIPEFQSLQKLDLSFNSLTGQIPSELFNINSLTYLFLGNNSLSGTLPSRKSENLKTIDVSYNHLSGNLPSWIDSSLQLNLVANNFTLYNSDIRLLPGLQCLQRGFPCNRNAPRYANFAIKCGGPQMTAGGIVFEAENNPLGAATFNVIRTQKWAVSNVGLYEDRENPLYVQNSFAQVKNTNTPSLYFTSRISPVSLRYYGLGLENGPYTVNLFFAETAYPDRSTRSSKSLGRRIFDIYIQGGLQVKDFDISKEAGGSERAITRRFTANVTDNHLEIHLLWTGKGTCCVPELGYYGPSISAVSVVPDFKPTLSGLPALTSKKKTTLIVGIAVPVGAAVLMLIYLIIHLKRRKKYNDEEVLLAIGPRTNIFSYAELKAATEDFSPSNKLGEGGFGAVFKGTFSDGRVVAVKQLSVASHQGKNQFIAEVATISAVQHRNLVKLHGCCIEGKRNLLVYEYLENKSLDQALFGLSDLHLDWPTRFNICLETARGLAYLHEESRPRIVHRDIKASNILLDAELCPKYLISDWQSCMMTKKHTSVLGLPVLCKPL